MKGKMDMKFVEQILREHCPILQAGRIQAGYFGAKAVRFAVAPVAAEPVLRYYTDGGSLEQEAFLFQPKKYFDTADEGITEAYRLSEAISQWAAAFQPEPGCGGVRFLKIEMLNGGFVFEEGRRQYCYRIHGRLLYERRWRCAAGSALVGREEKVAFYGLSASETYVRMEEFTELLCRRNPSLEGQEPCAAAYSPAVSYCFDQYRDNPVHADLIGIHYLEKAGGDAVREILLVDRTQPVRSGQYRAYLHSVTVVPESEGQALRTCRYCGSFYARMPVVCGVAFTEDGWRSCRFTAEQCG